MKNRPMKVENIYNIFTKFLSQSIEEDGCIVLPAREEMCQHVKICKAILKKCVEKRKNSFPWKRKKNCNTSVQICFQSNCENSSNNNDLKVNYE